MCLSTEGGISFLRFKEMGKYIECFKEMQFFFSSCHCVVLRFNTYVILLFRFKWNFCLMCGETAVQTITVSLEEYTPKLLQYAGYEEPESISDKEMILVLEALDRSV